MVDALEGPELYVIDGKTLEEFVFKSCSRKVIPDITLRESDWKEIARCIGKINS